MDFSTTARNERRDSQLEEVSEFFNTGFSLGKRKSSDGMQISMFEPITMPYSKCSRQRLETNAPSEPILSYGKDANDSRLAISCSPLHSNPEVQMEVKGNGSQQQHFNHRLSPVASAVVPISDHSSFDNYMDTEDRTGALLHRNPKLQRETNVLSRNHIDGPHNSVIYHYQHVARRRRREKVSLFSKPWAAYPSLEDRQKEERKIIKDGFKKRRMLL